MIDKLTRKITEAAGTFTARLHELGVQQTVLDYAMGDIEEKYDDVDLDGDIVIQANLNYLEGVADALNMTVAELLDRNAIDLNEES